MDVEMARMQRSFLEVEKQAGLSLEFRHGSAPTFPFVGKAEANGSADGRRAPKHRQGSS